MIGRTRWRRAPTWPAASPVRRSPVETTEPWRVIATSKHGVYVDGQSVELDPASGLRQRQLYLGRMFSRGPADDGILSFEVGLIGTDTAPRSPAEEAGDKAATATAAEAALVTPESLAPSAAAHLHPMTAAQTVAATTKGVTLERANSASGCRFVQTLRDNYRVQLFYNGKAHYLRRTMEARPPGKG